MSSINSNDANTVPVPIVSPNGTNILSDKETEYISKRKSILKRGITPRNTTFIKEGNTNTSFLDILSK